MTLQICFIDHPESELVGKFQNPWVAGVVTAAEGVDIVSLHQDQVLPDKVEWDGPPVKWVVVVSVDTAEPDGLAIDADQAVL